MGRIAWVPLFIGSWANLHVMNLPSLGAGHNPLEKGKCQIRTERPLLADIVRLKPYQNRHAKQSRDGFS